MRSGSLVCIYSFVVLKRSSVTDGRFFDFCKTESVKMFAILKKRCLYFVPGGGEPMSYGHPDNMSTQAARRVCKKRGIDWENYTDWDSYIKVS